MNIRISADSTCDLSPELIEKYDIRITPLYIVRDGQSLVDGKDITPDEIYAHVNSGGGMCSTAAVSVYDYTQFFRRQLEECDAVVHFHISGDMSACYQNACIAAQEVGNVYPVDSRSLSTGIGQLVTLAFYLVIYRLRPVSVHITRKGLHGTRGITARLYAVGIPAALNLALPSLLISCLNALLAELSQAYVVVLGIYYKLQTFLYLPASGIVQGMRPLIGYNYGAGEIKRVKKLFGISVLLNGMIMLAGTIICFTASETLMGMFTENPETVRLGTAALQIISIGFIPSAISVTASGALEGLSKGAQSLVISLLRYIIVIIPAAYLLCHFAGADAVWNAFWICELATAAVVCIGIKYYWTDF